VPPIEPSLRGSLLTGASALALSVSGSGAYAQTATQGQGTPQTWTVWVEAAWFQTAGGNVNYASLPGFGAPFTAVTPQPGLEGAFGFDYRFTNAPMWHFVFDFRYGQSRSSSANSSYHHSSVVFITPSRPFMQTNTASSQTTERESHLVTDFMIGRDVGLGLGPHELELGLRIADLWADAHTNVSGQQTFYSGTAIHNQFTATGNWNSGFFGFGPRAAITGDVPLVGFWSFDYEAGIAALFGYRSLTSAGVATVTTTHPFFPSFTPIATTSTFAFTHNSMAFVFNTDGWVALSYWFTPNVKLSAGMRTDFYDSALTTYNVNTGALENVSRNYWGPFLRLTGKF